MTCRRWSQESWEILWWGKLSGPVHSRVSSLVVALPSPLSLAHAHTLKMLHRSILHALIKFKLLTFCSLILIIHHRAIEEPHSCLLPGFESETRVSVLCKRAACAKWTSSKAPAARWPALSPSQLPICYHSPTPFPCSFVAAGTDSLPNKGDFQGIHMYRVFRDDDR